LDLPTSWRSRRDSRRSPTAARYPRSRGCSLRSPLQVAALRGGERESGADETDVRECLGEVAERCAGLRIDFFAVQAHIVGALEQVSEGGDRLGDLTRAGEGVDRPESADAERALSGRQAVRFEIAKDEPVAPKPGAYRANRGEHTRRLRLDVAVSR